MKVIKLHGIKDLRFHDEAIPEPGHGEVLIRIVSVGVCASDLHWYKDGHIGSVVLTEPTVLGHEPSGIIEKVGPGISHLKAGDRIAIEPSKPCYDCDMCRAGHFNVCPNVQFLGTASVNGCFREYMVWPAKLCCKIPDTMSLTEAAMLEPLGVGLYAVELAGIEKGATVAVLGAGAIGLSVLQGAKAKGAGKILVSEPIKERREIARMLGADLTCAPDELDIRGAELTNKKGFDIVFECAGESEAVRQSGKAASILGKVVVVGIPYDDIYVFDASVVRRKQLNVSFVRRNNLPIENVIKFVQEKNIQLKPYVTHFFSLDRLEEALELAATRANGVLRMVVEMTAQ